MFGLGNDGMLRVEGAEDAKQELPVEARRRKSTCAKPILAGHKAGIDNAWTWC